MASDADRELTIQEKREVLGWDPNENNDFPPAPGEVVDEDEGVETPASETPPPASAEPEPSSYIPPVEQIPPPPTPPVPPDPMGKTLAQREAQLVHQQEWGRINQEAFDYRNQLISQGNDEAEAYKAAVIRANGEWSNYQNVQLSQQGASDRKELQAYKIAQQYQVPVSHLSNLPVEAMESAARSYRETVGTVNELKAQIAKGNLAPVQQMDSNRQTSSNSQAAVMARYAAGATMTEAEDKIVESRLGPK